MSRLICTSAMDGAARWIAQAEGALDAAIRAKGEAHPAGFPDTAYFLPIAYSFTGLKVETLGDLRQVLRRAKELLPARPLDAGGSTWLPYLGCALDAGVASLFACEAIEACKYALGSNPVSGIWLGAASDVLLRERGVEFVDGTAPGFAAITGAAPSNAIAVKIARELQEKNLYVFMAGETNGKQFAEQLAEEGVQLGWETRLVPFGKDVSALAYALGFANRAALSFGGVKPGDFEANLRYNKNRIFAFVLALGEVDAAKYAVAAGAINYGFPIIADTDIPEILPTGVCTYEHVVANVPHATMVEKALEVRGCKVRITKVPIPTAYGSAFEGERIRKADVHAEFGGNITPCFEFVTSVSMSDITDGAIEIVGPDIDMVEPGTALPLAVWVEVAGRKMQPDFEPILERQIHHLVNGAEGIMHIGQRDIAWLRISKAGFAKGLRLKHIGEVLHAKLLSDYPAIVDKVRVTLITERAEVERRLAHARTVYDERNRRMESMTDESVDIFYSCLLCQSFAPDHVCIITPERLGLCGAYNWLDGKAAHEIDETGPNQPVAKGECLDPVRGVWRGVNEYVHAKSHKTIESITAYSIMNDPMTSCGCFEVIVGFVPECNGIMAVNREYAGETPVGMKFSTLAGNVGGGQQTPGFMGCGKVFLTSRKFVSAEGGHKRIVWMPKELKDLLAPDLKKRFAEAGVPDLLDKIADETVATDPLEIRKYLEQVGHPALGMEDMAELAQRELGRALPSPDPTRQGNDFPGPSVQALDNQAQGQAKASRAPGQEMGVGGQVPTPAAAAALAAPAQAMVHSAQASNQRNQVSDQHAQGAPTRSATVLSSSSVAGGDAAALLASGLLEQIKAEVAAQVRAEIKGALVKEIVADIVGSLTSRYLDGQAPSVGTGQDQHALSANQAQRTLAPEAKGPAQAASTASASPAAPGARADPAAAASASAKASDPTPRFGGLGAGAQPATSSGQSAASTAGQPATSSPIAPMASARIGALSKLPVRKDKHDLAIRAVTLGATREQGGTRSHTLTVGGAACMPFHLWEGAMPHRPLVAMEVFDVLGEKYPPVLREIHGDLLHHPADMARACVEKYGADLISVRLDGTHPERGNRSPEQAVEVVKSVLAAVGVPLIVTGHGHFERNNEVMKAVAQACAGENLLLNWVEQDNYRQIAGAALAYGHTLAAQSPIDVNIAKQLNILLTNMDVKPERILIDPMTGALGYGLEYTYSVMERIRLTALGGDAMLAQPMILSPGQECAKVKELKASAAEFPAWGELKKRAALWELATATSFLHAGADVLIMYHPEAAMALKRTIARLMDGQEVN